MRIALKPFSKQMRLSTGKTLRLCADKIVGEIKATSTHERDCCCWHYAKPVSEDIWWKQALWSRRKFARSAFCRKLFPQ